MVNDKDIKGILKVAQDTEIRLAGSLLKWKYKKEGKDMPDEKMVQDHSRIITHQLHKILSQRGKNILKGLKDACFNTNTKGDPRG